MRLIKKIGTAVLLSGFMVASSYGETITATVDFDDLVLGSSLDGKDTENIYWQLNSGRSGNPFATIVDSNYAGGSGNELEIMGYQTSLSPKRLGVEPDDGSTMIKMIELAFGHANGLSIYFSASESSYLDLNIHDFSEQIGSVVVSEHLSVSWERDEQGNGFVRATGNIHGVSFDTRSNASDQAAYIDNVRVTTGVPEPASLGLLVLGGFGVLRRTR